MRGSMRNLWSIAVICLFLLTACGGGGQEASSVDPENPPDPPAPYAGKTNPMAGDPGAVQAGEEIFQINCASCHGQTGAGDGPAAMGLSPKPVNLMEVGGKLSDAYMFWRISEGGGMAPFNSAMPAWKGILSEEKIWQTVSYIRTLHE